MPATNGKLSGEDNPFIGTRFFQFTIDPVNTDTIFAATSKGVYRTLDGGDKWKILTGLPKISESVKAVFRYNH